jgi:hypothetical protein
MRDAMRKYANMADVSRVSKELIKGVDRGGFNVIPFHAYVTLLAALSASALPNLSPSLVRVKHAPKYWLDMTDDERAEMRRELVVLNRAARVAIALWDKPSTCRGIAIRYSRAMCASATRLLYRMGDKPPTKATSAQMWKKSEESTRAHDDATKMLVYLGLASKSVRHSHQWEHAAIIETVQHMKLQRYSNNRRGFHAQRMLDGK